MQAITSIKNQSGFTLIEALIAIAIFSIGLMAVGFLQANSLRETGNIAQKTQALAVADAYSDWLKSLPFYTDVTAQTFSPALVEGTYNQAAPPPNDNTYTVHWTVEDWDDGTYPLPPYNNTATPVLEKVGDGTYVVGKYIRVVVTPLNGDMNADRLAEIQFTKTWAMTRIPGV